tara:strand:- start:3216 stop:3896 length:681 start_codon:yes stop_codon:yes gene_type:complete
MTKDEEKKNNPSKKEEINNTDENKKTKDDIAEKKSDETDNNHLENDISEEERLSEELSNLKDEKIRLLAEMENLRKRFEREKIDSLKFGSSNFARDILTPGDNLERALSAIDEKENHSQSIKNLIEGLYMVKKELQSALEKNGIKKIETKNKKFDPNLHQAMMEIERNDIDEGLVVQEIQTGYMMHERLLRPAMVGVSKKVKKDESLDGKNTDEDINDGDNKTPKK